MHSNIGEMGDGNASVSVFAGGWTLRSKPYYHQH